MAKPEVAKASTPQVGATITAHAARGTRPATVADLLASESRILAAIATSKGA